jgi:hypothetical protein
MDTGEAVTTNTGLAMQHTDPTALVLARLAAAERALAARSAEAALARGVRRATPWWEAPRECVAMLSRHAGVAEVVSAALGGTSSAEWAARLPDLTGCATTTLRDARAAWLDALRALARGESVTVPPIPPPDRAPPDPVLPAAAPAEPPEGLPQWPRRGRRRGPRATCARSVRPRGSRPICAASQTPHRRPNPTPTTHPKRPRRGCGGRCRRGATGPWGCTSSRPRRTASRHSSRA